MDYVVYTLITVFGFLVIGLAISLTIRIIVSLVKLVRNVQAIKDSQIRMEEMYRLEHPDIAEKFDEGKEDEAVLRVVNKLFDKDTPQR